MKITKKTRVSFLACIIGDGHIRKDGVASIIHGEKQKEFLEWKKIFLEKNGVRCFEIKEINNNGYIGYKMLLS